MPARPDKHRSRTPAKADAPPRRSPLRRLARRSYRTLRGVLALGMLLHVVLVCTPLIDPLRDWLTVTGPPEPADVIVCLGGRSTRVLLAADMFHRGLAPRVVVSNRPGAAEGMRNLMIRAGVPAEQILVDATSYTTADHPAGVARAARIDPARHRLLIVTDHEHSRRAAACFRRAGYRQFTLYGGSKRKSTDRGIRWRFFVLPHVVYEYAALAQYRLLGKI